MGRRNWENLEMTTIRTLLLGLVLALGFETAAQAGNADLKYLQEQLNAAGQNAGTPDGVWGGKTDRSGDAFLTTLDEPVPGLEDRDLTKTNWPLLARHFRERDAMAIADLSTRCGYVFVVDGTEKIRGHWTGVWGEGEHALNHHLVVSDVTDEGVANGYYAFGNKGECYSFSNASWNGETLTITEWTDWGISSVTYNFDGGVIRGDYRSSDGNAKGVFFPRPDLLPGPAEIPQVAEF